MRKAEYNPKRASGSPKGRARKSWEECVTAFKAHLAMASRSRHTIVHYGNDLECFEKWWKANSGSAELSLGKITEADLSAWEHYLGAEKLPIKGGRERKPASVNAKLSAIRSFLFWAQRQGIIRKAPESPPRRKLGVRPVKWLDRNQQNTLLRAAARDTPRNYCIIVVLLGMGLRVDELVQLRWYDLEIGERKGWITVRHGKGRKPRRLPLTRESFKQIKAQKDRESPSAADDQIFRSQIKDKTRPGERKPLSIRGVQQIVGKYSAELGLRSLFPHQLRHTCAVNLKNKGVAWPTIAAWLGHTSTVTTMDHYSTPSDRDLEDAAGIDFDD